MKITFFIAGNARKNGQLLYQLFIECIYIIINLHHQS
jgi:hypothetical protein